MIKMTVINNIKLCNLKYKIYIWNSIRPASIRLMKLILNKVKYAQNRKIKLSIHKICELTSMSKSSINNGIYMLVKLGIIKSISELILKENKINQLNENTAIEKFLFDHIILFEPFIEYIYLFGKLKSDEKAAEQLKIIFDIKTSSKTIRNTFNGWIKKLNMKIDNQESVASSEFLKTIEEESQTIITMRRVYNKDLKSLPDIVIHDLIEALIQANVDPSNSLTDTGRALENYLRIKFSSLMDLSNCNGISQIADKIRQLKKINSKHINIIKAIGSLRTMGDSHGLDKIDGKKWGISKESALISCYLAVKTISSIESYLNNNLSF